MALEDGKIRIDKFDGRDFGFWKMQIEDYLYQKKLYEPLTGKKPDKMSEEEWKLLDRQALGVIRLTLSKNVAFNIINEKTTADLMKALGDMYEKPTASNKVYLMRRLFNMRMGEGGYVVEHINEFNSIITQLNSVGIKFEDEVQALLLLSSLPDSWGATVTAVSSTSGQKKLELQEIRDMILSEDIRRRESDSVSGAALSAEGRGRSDQRGFGGSRDKSRSRACWKCGQKGHVKRNCPEKKHQEEGVNATYDSDDALVCCVESSLDSWVLDSGASYHATSRKDLMKNYVAGKFGKVHMGCGETLDVVGKGEVDVKTPHGMQWNLKNVRYVPGLRKNLISMSQLDDDGYVTVFKGGSWKITRGNMVVARGTKVGTLYTVGTRKKGVERDGSTGGPRVWTKKSLGNASRKDASVKWESAGKVEEKSLGKTRGVGGNERKLRWCASIDSRRA